MHRAFHALLLLATIPAAVAAQEPATPAGPLSLLQAIAFGRKQAVSATIARLNVRAADARTAQRRADLLPNISGAAQASMIAFEKVFLIMGITFTLALPLLLLFRTGRARTSAAAH